MKQSNEHLDTLHDIKQMMERSSRFISLSGWSGVSAGICALAGAWFAHRVIDVNYGGVSNYENLNENHPFTLGSYMGSRLFLIAMITFIAAFVLAFLFTYLRSRKNNIPIWGTSARRLLVNVSIPMIAGAIYLLKLIESGAYGLIAPGCLIFYGLALVNASKYTLNEVRYLGYGQIIIGIVNCWAPGYGLYFWAAGFGILHIVYGIVMWKKYEN